MLSILLKHADEQHLYRVNTTNSSKQYVTDFMIDIVYVLQSQLTLEIMVH